MSKRHLASGLLLLAVLLVYANSFGNGFHFDDFHTVTDNPAVRSLGNLPRIFTDATAFSVLPANQTYRPVVTASLALDYALGRGYNVFWFHLSTMIWFLLLLVMIDLFAEGIFDRVRVSAANRWLALGVAAWFGLHPAMAETVNYVIQRGDLYCTLGCVTGLWMYAARPGWRRYGVYLAPFALAMLSKPPAAVFPVLLLCYVFFFEAEALPLAKRWRAAGLAILPAVGVDAALLVLQSAMTPKSYAPTILSASAYRLVQPFVWLRYCGALLLPLHLNVDTDLEPISQFNAQAAVGLVFVAGLAVGIWYAARRQRLYPIAFGLLWFVVTQLPTSMYTLSEVENDHRMFFSFPGLMIAVVWALYLGWEWVAGLEPGRRVLAARVAAGLGLTALGGYAYGAHRRNIVWHSEASLWADDAVKSPHNGRGLMNYGLIKMGEGDFNGARDLFNRALRYTPNYATLEVNLGIDYGMLADANQPALTPVAEGHFQRALSLSPNDDTTHAYYGRWLLTHRRLQEATSQLEAAVALNGQRQMQRDLLMEAYAEAGNTGAARALAQATVRVIPNDADAAVLLGGGTLRSGAAAAGVARFLNASLAAYRAGQFERSIAEAQAVLQVDPRSAEAWNNIGAGFGAMRRWDEGIAAEREALQLNPGLEIAANNLRWFTSQKAAGSEGAKTAAAYVNESLALNRAGKYPESAAAARKALAVDPSSAEAWNNIAADDEALKKWDEAIEAARRAIALRPDFQLARNNLAWSLQQKAAGQ